MGRHMAFSMTAGGHTQTCIALLGPRSCFDHRGGSFSELIPYSTMRSAAPPPILCAITIEALFVCINRIRESGDLRYDTAAKSTDSLWDI